MDAYTQRRIDDAIAALLSACTALDEIDLSCIVHTVHVAIDQCNNHAIGRKENKSFVNGDFR